MPCIRYYLAFSFLIYFTHTVQAAPLVKVQPLPMMNFTVEPYLYGPHENFWPSIRLNGGALLDFNHRVAVWGAIGMQTLPHLSPLPTQYQWWTQQDPNNREALPETYSQPIDTSGVSLSSLHRGTGIRFAVMSNFIAGVYYHQDETLAHYIDQSMLEDNNGQNSWMPNIGHTHKFNNNQQLGIELLHPFCRFNLGWYLDSSGTPLKSTEIQENISTHNPYIYKASSKLFVPLQGAITAKVSILSGRTKPFLSSYYIPFPEKSIRGFTAGCEYHLHPMLNTSVNVKYDTVQKWRASFTMQAGWIGDNKKDTQYKDTAYYLNQSFDRESMPTIFAPNIYLQNFTDLDEQRKALGLKTAKELQHLPKELTEQYISDNSLIIRGWLQNAETAYYKSFQAYLCHAYPGNIAVDEDNEPTLNALIRQLKWSPECQAIFNSIDGSTEAHATLLHEEELAQCPSSEDQHVPIAIPSSPPPHYERLAQDSIQQTLGTGTFSASTKLSSSTDSSEGTTSSDSEEEERDNTHITSLSKTAGKQAVTPAQVEWPPLLINRHTSLSASSNSAPSQLPKKTILTRTILTPVDNNRSISEGIQQQNNSSADDSGDSTHTSFRQPAGKKRSSMPQIDQPALPSRASSASQAQLSNSTNTPSVIQKPSLTRRTVSTPAPVPVKDDHSDNVSLRSYATGTTAVTTKSLHSHSHRRQSSATSTTLSEGKKVPLTKDQIVYSKGVRITEDGQEVEAVIDWIVSLKKGKKNKNAFVPILTRTKENGIECRIMEGKSYQKDPVSKKTQHKDISSRSFYLQYNPKNENALTGRFKLKSDGNAVECAEHGKK